MLVRAAEGPAENRSVPSATVRLLQLMPHSARRRGEAAWLIARRPWTGPGRGAAPARKLDAVNAWESAGTSALTCYRTGVAGRGTTARLCMQRICMENGVAAVGRSPVRMLLAKGLPTKGKARMLRRTRRDGLGARDTMRSLVRPGREGRGIAQLPWTR